MAVIDKKHSLKKSKAPAKRANHFSRPSSAKLAAPHFDPVADARECEKISKTLDVNAFLAFHKRNSANQRYWKSQE